MDHSKKNHFGLPPNKSSLEYRPAIDGLRALAVLSVFIFHLNHRWMPGGFVGVDIFFVISGYLISSIIYKECKSSTFSFIRFYQRRIARIFPAFFVVAIFSISGAACLYTSHDFATAGSFLSYAVLSITNLKQMLLQNYFENSPDAMPFMHYWSLSVEEQFYIFTPLILFILFKYANKYQTAIWISLFLASLAACIIITRWNSTYGFYLLPTRAWELLAGTILAIAVNNHKIPRADWIPVLGLGTVLASFYLIHESPQFPGVIALLPVVGAAALLYPNSGSSLAEKTLSLAPLVVIGRISYSLYLWHWPIFSFIDYKYLFDSETFRVILKCLLSFVAAGASFCLVETPLRSLLNRRDKVKLAYTFMLCGLLVSATIGFTIRKNVYIDAKSSDVAKGGLVFPEKDKKGSVILFGDSYAGMYGKLLKDVSADCHYEFTMLGVDGEDPLPSARGQQTSLWLNSLRVVENKKPDYLILACFWSSKLKFGLEQVTNQHERLEIALAALKPYAKHIIILNQPPSLPLNFSRDDIRRGVRPPFYEENNFKIARENANKFLLTLSSDNVVLLDVAPEFLKAKGEILYFDDRGRTMYQNFNHLSGLGADRIKFKLVELLSK